MTVLLYRILVGLAYQYTRWLFRLFPHLRALGAAEDDLLMALHAAWRLHRDNHARTR